LKDANFNRSVFGTFFHKRTNNNGGYSKYHFGVLIQDKKLEMMAVKFAWELFLRVAEVRTSLDRTQNASLRLHPNG
jgi:hypothetical protein